MSHPNNQLEFEDDEENLLTPQPNSDHGDTVLDMPPSPGSPESQKSNQNLHGFSSNEYNSSSRSQNPSMDQMTHSVRRVFCSCRHPITAFFTLFVKLVTIALYFLTSSYLFGSYISFATRFVLVILLLAADFWIVKNISGRLLVGLRYWNQVDEDGKSKWIYESKEDRNSIDLVDSYMFWISLYAWPVFWIACILLSLFTFAFTSVLINSFALVIAMINVYGYTKCMTLKGAHQRFTSSLVSFGARRYIDYLSRSGSNTNDNTAAQEDQFPSV